MTTPKDKTAKAVNSPTAVDDAKATAAASTSASGDRPPEEIRAEIDETREEMGETVAAVAAKTDVKAQAQAKVEEVKEKAKAAAPASPQEGIAQAQAYAKQNPKPVAIAGALVGLFLLWRLLKS